MERGDAESISFAEPHCAVAGAANPRSVRQHRLEHWLELTGRAADDGTSEVAVCCSSASDNSRVRACTSSNSRTFSIAITAWSAKVLTSSICFSVNGSTVLRVKTSTPVGMPSRSIGTPRTVRTLANPDPTVSLISGSALVSTT